MYVVCLGVDGRSDKVEVKGWVWASDKGDS